MSEKDDFYKRIVCEMSAEDFNKAIQRARNENPNVAKKIDKIERRRKIKKVAKLLGIGETYHSSGNSVRSYEPYHGGPAHHNSPRPPTNMGAQPSPFSPAGFNPVEAENLALYLRSIDGKGDPQPCDCDHEK